MTFNIKPLDRSLEPALHARLDSRTKPQGSLGRLESVALQAGLIQRTLTPQLHTPRVAVFAGDHGAAKAGVSAFPQEVTPQMVLNFLHGGAAINVLSRQGGLELAVIDAGVASDVPWESRPGVDFIVNKVGYGTANYLETAAMTPEQRDLAIEKGADLIRRWRAAGCNAIGFGEMGIGNTASASLLTHLITGATLHTVVGRGTGLDDAGLDRKRHLLGRALSRLNGRRLSAKEALAEYGGFEIAMMTGAYLAAAECGMIIVVDGFIATSALLVAREIAPEVLDYCVFSHRSAEPGHRAQHLYLGVTPLLELDLRLGEGSGAALAFPIIRSALALMNDMAGFADAGVSEKQ